MLPELNYTPTADVTFVLSEAKAQGRFVTYFVT